MRRQRTGHGMGATAGRLAVMLAAAAMLAAPTAEAFPKPKYPTRTEDLPKGEPKAPPQADAPKPAAVNPEPPPPETRAVPSSVVESGPLEPAKAEPARADAAEARPALTFDDPPQAPKPLDVVPAKAAPEKKKPAAPVEKLEARKPDAPKTQPMETTGYVVQRGDTLSGIARRFGVPSSKLMEANGLTSANGLKAGAKLKLPSGARDSGKDPYATGPALTSPAKAPPAKVAPRPDAAKTTKPAPSPGLPPATTVTTTKAPPKVAPSGPVESRTPPPLALPSSSPFPTDGQIRTLGEGRFVWPVRGEVLSPFGQLGPGLRNDGLNLSASAGSPVRAAAGGEVVYAGNAVPGYGNLVLIKHSDGWVTAYGHLDTVSVRMRDRVTQGQQIGTVGQTGGVDRPQLHFEIRYAPSTRDKARPVDPNLVLPGN